TSKDSTAIAAAWRKPAMFFSAFARFTLVLAPPRSAAAPIACPLRLACGQITTATRLALTHLPPGGNTPPGVLVTLLGLAAHQDSGLAGVVGRAAAASVPHAPHEWGRPVIPDLQPPLDVARRGLAVAHHDLHRLLIEIGRIARPHPGRIKHGCVLVLLVDA